MKFSLYIPFFCTFCTNVCFFKYRAEKASERLEAARVLLESRQWNDAINRTYVAIFTGARNLLALFVSAGKKHSGVISLFNRHFIKTGSLSKHLSKIITNDREGRESSDYAGFVEHTEEKAQAQYEQAEEFLLIVQGLTDKQSKVLCCHAAMLLNISTEGLYSLGLSKNNTIIS